MARSDTKWAKNEELATLRSTLYAGYMKKYWILFLSRFKLTDFDYGVPTYILDSIYRGRSLASFKLLTPADTSIVGFQPYTEVGFDLYNNPVGIKITPTKDYNKIPFAILINNEDCALFRCDYSIYNLVSVLVLRLVDIDMTIRTNIKLHKIPFLLNGGDNLTQVISDVLSDKEVVGVGEGGLDALDVKSVNTNTPYLIDKLQQAKVAINTEILTIIGVKGQKQEKMAQMTVDEVNMNDDEVNGLFNRMFDKLKEWLDKTNELFGTKFGVEVNNKVDDEPTPQGGSEE